MNNSLEILRATINKHQPFIVNYGKGYMSDEDIREKTYWDDYKKAYRSETGTWDMKLLFEIARGEVENISIEFIGE